MTTPAFKPSEGKREEFRKYLEKNGIMDALTKVLVNLYEEVDKPEDALQYIIDKLSIQAGLDTQKQLSAKLEDANNRVKSLEEQLENLRLESNDQEAEIKTEGEVEPQEEEQGPPPDIE
ncbi:hypothetical protein JTB14_021479 [Gonioctena quinquepunctata]|nr:hypothetical protein JTB14_021479 [Gonioctena quinquepunctata]